jgi:hypothetical protein
MQNLCDVQAKLFTVAYALATQTGRAIFYIYVGSMTMLLLPEDSTFWAVTYCVIGGVLVLLALYMLIVDWCGGCLGCRQED